MYFSDIWGKREYKYSYLAESDIGRINWNVLDNIAPNYFFVTKDFDVFKSYEKGFEIIQLFKTYGMGVTTGNDSDLIAFDKARFANKLSNENVVEEINYRLFDTRYIYYDTKEVERAREALMSHMRTKSNLGLLSLRGVRNNLTSKFGITNKLIDKSVLSTLDNGYIFPLYLYPASTLGETTTRTPNLNKEIIARISERLGIPFVPEKAPSPVEKPGAEVSFAPIDLLDYIYAVLHSPTYRHKYKEFLKIDFPRVPYPKDAATFWQLVALGGQLRQLHLLESPAVKKPITQYPADGTNLVEKIRFQPYAYENAPEGQYPDYLGDVYINDIQYFAGVPQSAWEFYIGGYQPAQKWLKDRKGRQLTYEDVRHYQQIIVALSETARLMKEIEQVELE